MTMRGITGDILGPTLPAKFRCKALVAVILSYATLLGLLAGLTRLLDG